MPNPYGNLAGFTDPEEPGWQERAIERVRAKQRKSSRTSERKSGMYLFFDDPFRVLLNEASFRRDISMTGYGRRAVSAFIAHDLGLPFEAVSQFTAQPAVYKGRPGGKLIKTNDDGTGHGLWVIGNLDEE